ncbi:biopolymer transporter ExbD [Pacificimonas flava]|uniref:Biopolymer transporter ExbD n=2 Tax=Pacificimonas TaxID=1960290 RepID=A0A219B7W4_9SPHN|nr:MULTISPECIES: biopolymer transporter ExbD [Pacificimonas]MBZ6379924.1 biopolymer transporter ExbD [Pacificimonas aurantium]OWV34447.1 biopolymer transporter ExbD [Pacificimonas flava]
MGMSVGEAADDAPMATINTTPLVDVMLVLLIIFLITVPVVIQTVPLELPNVRSTATTTKPENVSLSVNAQGDVFIGQARMDDYEELRRTLVARLEEYIDEAGGPGNVTELPEVHIRGDAGVEYQNIGGVIYTVQRAGYIKIAFISEPPAGNVSRAIY